MRQIKNVSIKKYHQIHHWLKINFGKAYKCENKNCKNISKLFSWALKNSCEYEFKRENYLMLCRSCHAKIDISLETRKRISDKRKGIKLIGENRKCLMCGKLMVNPHISKRYCNNCRQDRYKYTHSRWAKENKDKMRIWWLNYRKNNKAKLKEYHRNYSRKKYENKIR